MMNNSKSFFGKSYSRYTKKAKLEMVIKLVSDCKLLRLTTKLFRLSIDSFGTFGRIQNIHFIIDICVFAKPVFGLNVKALFSIYFGLSNKFQHVLTFRSLFVNFCYDS